MKNDLENITRKINELRKIAKEEIVNVRKDIGLIIRDNKRDGREIENLLDHTLNLTLLGVGDKEFHELNDFYATFDLQGAEDYKIFYEEMTERKY
ncbi:MAG: hypothetical protein AABX99_03020 [Nanoarchaeota archaeon]